MKPRTRLPLMAIFAIPTAIALVTTVGLVTALLDDRLVDAVSWASLSVPVLAAAWCWRRRKR